MWLTGATVLDHLYGFREADVEIADGHFGRLGAPARRSGGADASGLVLMPGLFDAHYHGGSSLLSGLGAGMQIHDWGDGSPQGLVQRHLFDWLDEFAPRTELQTVLRKEYLELLCQGVTYIADSGLSDQGDGLAEAVLSEIGLRGSVECSGPGDTMVVPDDMDCTLHIPEEEDLDERSLAALVTAATEAARLTGHCLETTYRRAVVEERFGHSTVDVLEGAGLLSARTVLFHGCLMDEHDIARVAATNASIVHCPVSNLLTGGRVAPLKAWLDAGVTVALGTDWADTDFWGTVRAARNVLAAQGERQPATPARLLKLASHGGASCYGRSDLGSIVEGKAADLVCLDADALRPYVEAGSVSTLASAIVQRACPSLVRHVMVGGEWVVREQLPTRVSLSDVCQRYTRLATELSREIERRLRSARP